MLKAKKIHRNIFTAVKLILLCGLIYLIYRQVTSPNIEAQGWPEVYSYSILILSIVLVYPNIGLAYRMWLIIIKRAEIISDKKSRVESFFAGLITGMLTPNMLGNFIGRLYYFDKSHRGSITALTLLSNYAQFVVSLCFGFISVLLMGSIPDFIDSSFLRWSVLFVLLISVIVYFFFEKIVHWFYKKVDQASFKKVLDDKPILRWELLLNGASRYVVFSAQYMLILIAFGEPFSLTLILAVWQVYLFTMAAPSLFLGKIGVKESIALMVLTQIGISPYVIVISSLIIWFVNSLSPALLGLIICKENKAYVNR